MEVRISTGLAAILVTLLLAATGCTGTSVENNATGDTGEDVTDTSADDDTDNGEDTGTPEDSGSDDTGIEDSGPADSGTDDTGTNDTGTDQDTTSDTGIDTGRDCPSTHERVGWTAEITDGGVGHGVSGHAEIIDDCTVRITDFEFDGSGPNVHVYGAADGNFSSGFSMTDALARPTPYEGETIIAKLPEGESLDNLDAISVWCVDFEVDFGSGTFSAP